MTFSEKKRADLIVKNGTVLVMDRSETIIENGFVAICGDGIAEVASEESLAGWEAEKTIDARGGIIMPGFVNTHTHAAMTCFRGLADDLPLMTWLNDHIFPAEAKLDHDMVFKGSMLACAEMIMSGTTTFCDMYLFEDAVAEAASLSGMRAVVGEVLYNFPSPCYGPLEKGFEYTENLINKWNKNSLITIAVEPHSPYLCSPFLLKTASSIAKKHGVPLVIHLSETLHEVDQIREEHGKSPVEYLAEQGFLDERLIAAHCVYLSQNDLDLLRSFDVKIAHNPVSNMKLASGIAPVPSMIAHGLTVGLGTDGCASNNNLDMFREMDACAKLHKVSTLDPTVMNAHQTLRMATADGVKVLGLYDVTGTIEKGKKADIIVIDTSAPHLCPMYNPYSHLVYAACGSDVSCTIVNGKVLMEERQLVSLDLQKIMSDVRMIARKIKG